MRRLNNIDKVYKIVFFLFAMFSTMPVVALPIAGRTISMFTIFIPIAATILFLRFRFENLKSCGFFKYIILFLIIAVFSTIVGHFYFAEDPIYVNVSIKSLPKIIMWLIIMLGFAGSDIKQSETESLAKGFFVGVLANLIWGCLDGLGFYLTGYSLNNFVFSNYIETNNIRLGSLSIVLKATNSIRVGGFNWDPAHIGMLAPVAFGYGLMRNKRWVQIVSIVALLMSQSMLGMFGMVIVLAMVIILETNKDKKVEIIRELLLIGILGIILLFVLGKANIIISFVNRVFDKFKGDSSTTYRAIYNFRILEAFKAAPVSGILGTGFNTASYPFFKAGLIDFLYPFDPESTYVAYLFDVGIVGVLLYLYLLLRITIEAAKKIFTNKCFVEILVFVGGISMISSKFFYHYIMYAVHMIIIIIGCLISKETYKKDMFEYENTFN